MGLLGVALRDALQHLVADRGNRGPPVVLYFWKMTGSLSTQSRDSEVNATIWRSLVPHSQFLSVGSGRPCDGLWTMGILKPVPSPLIGEGLLSYRT